MSIHWHILVIQTDLTRPCCSDFTLFVVISLTWEMDRSTWYNWYIPITCTENSITYDIPSKTSHKISYGWSQLNALRFWRWVWCMASITEHNRWHIVASHSNKSNCMYLQTSFAHSFVHHESWFMISNTSNEQSRMITFLGVKFKMVTWRRTRHVACQSHQSRDVVRGTSRTRRVFAGFSWRFS